MLSRIISGALEGVSAYLVCVEVDIASGLPGFNMVGSLSPEVRESRERVGVALKNAGIQMPPTCFKFPSVEHSIHLPKNNFQTHTYSIFETAVSYSGFFRQEKQLIVRTSIN